MEQEIWKDVVGYEGLYQVSSLGNVKRLAKEKTNGRGNHAREEHILSYYILKGYKCVPLRKDNKCHTCYISRLVATAFIPNPDNLPFVNHKDEDKVNNCVYNLEWCTQTYNTNYGTCPQRISSALSIPVVQKTLDGEVVNIYKSRTQASQETGIGQSHICACANGRLKQTGGYIWRNVTEGEKQNGK